MPPPKQTEIAGDPKGVYLHDAVLAACRKFPQKTALVDSSRISYAEYGEIVESLARGLVAAGVRPGEMVGIYLPNTWEFCATYHAAYTAQSQLPRARSAVSAGKFRRRHSRYRRSAGWGNESRRGLLREKSFGAN